MTTLYAACFLIVFGLGVGVGHLHRIDIYARRARISRRFWW